MAGDKQYMTVNVEDDNNPNKLTYDQLRCWITDEVYQSLLIDSDKLIRINASGGPILGGNYLETPGFMTSFPFQIKYIYKLTPKVMRCYALQYYVGKVIPIMHSDFEPVIRNIFEKDALVTFKVLDRINECLKEVHCAPLKYPTVRYIGINRPDKKNLIVFEDISKEDTFEIHDYRAALNFENALLVMKTYARLHAGSRLVQAKYKSIVDICPELGKDDLFEDLQLSMKLDEAMQGLLESNAFVLDKYDLSYDSVLWIRHAKTSIYQSYANCLKTYDKKFKVLTHGSIAQNLIYISKQRNAVGLSSFGGARISSPGEDINSFLFTCLTSNMRRVWLDDLVNGYYDTFKSILLSGNIQMPFTMEELKKEIMNKTIIGWISGMLSLPSYIGGREFSVDLNLFNFDDLKECISQYNEKLYTLYQQSPDFKVRFGDLHKDLQLFAGFYSS